VILVAFLAVVQNYAFWFFTTGDRSEKTIKVQRGEIYKKLGVTGKEKYFTKEGELGLKVFVEYIELMDRQKKNGDTRDLGNDKELFYKWVYDPTDFIPD
jgi:hypothetical protein